MSLDVEAGEAVGLIGPNGAGKTTFFNCLLGCSASTAATVTFAGQDLTRAPVYRRARAGIGRTFQRMELFADMTVRDHLLVAERSRLGTGPVLEGRAQPVGADGRRAGARGGDPRAARASPTSPTRRSRPCRSGVGGWSRSGRALMTDPKLLLLDEPSSGLDGGETAALADTLRAVQAERGTAILLVEHDVEFVRTFVSRVFVLDFGTLIAAGTTAEVLASDEVRRAYLGETV